MAAVGLAACDRQPQKAETPAEQGSQAPRAVTDPAVVVRQIYGPYLVQDGALPSLEEAAPWSEAMRAALSDMNARAAQAEEPILGFDPIVDAQDFGITGVAASSDGVVEGSHATVRATFNNFDQPQEVIYDLIWEDDRWVIDNVRTSDWDLRRIATGG